MTLLEQARDEINAIDKQMAELFEQRMKAVESVIQYKIENNMQIFDSSREAQVLEKNCALIQNTELKEYFKEFLIKQMDLSKQYQQNILDKQNK